MKTWTVTARLKRPDNGHTLRRTIDIVAADEAGATVASEHWMRQGGYSGYRVDLIISLELKRV